MKKIFTLMAVFTMTMAAMAQTASLAFDGKDKNKIIVKMTELEKVSTVGFKFVLPEGTTCVYDDDEEMYLISKNADRWTSAATADLRPGSTAGIWSVNIYNGKSKGTSGDVICEIPIQGTIDGVVRFYDINFSGADGVSYYMDGDDQKELFITLKPDAITSVSADKAKNGAIYNIAGQRVSKATKGVYVVDGKKVAVK